ncbi:hypothetical protein RB195_018219 [Necator americanus]|uniref:Uncharacterized protein n=1 Tax=Necator americanus TaxID=51031 RepID=A0ABR1CA99_NECAM
MEKNCLIATCDSRGVDTVANTSIATRTDAFEQPTTRIGRLQVRRCVSTSALTLIDYALPSSSEKEMERRKSRKIAKAMSSLIVASLVDVWEKTPVSRKYRANTSARTLTNYRQATNSLPNSRGREVIKEDLVEKSSSLG